MQGLVSQFTLLTFGLLGPGDFDHIFSVRTGLRSTLEANTVTKNLIAVGPDTLAPGARLNRVNVPNMDSTLSVWDPVRLKMWLRRVRLVPIASALVKFERLARDQFIQWKSERRLDDAVAWLGGQLYMVYSSPATS